MKDISIEEHKRWIELKEFYEENGYIYYKRGKLSSTDWGSQVELYATKPKTVSMALFRYWNQSTNEWNVLNIYCSDVDEAFQLIDVNVLEIEEIPNTREDLRIIS